GVPIRHAGSRGPGCGAHPAEARGPRIPRRQRPIRSLRRNREQYGAEAVPSRRLSDLGPRGHFTDALARGGAGAIPMSVRIAPSLLAADFARLADALAMAEAGGADLVRVDVMDGRFVPSLTIGPPVVA